MKLRIATKLLLALVFVGSALLMGDLAQANHKGFQCTVNWQNHVNWCAELESWGSGFECGACECYVDANCNYQKCINIDHLNICVTGSTIGGWDGSECNSTCGRGQILP